jgi:hypothetical protein
MRHKSKDEDEDEKNVFRAERCAEDVQIRTRVWRSMQLGQASTMPWDWRKS